MRILRRESIIDRCDDGTACGKSRNETFIMAGMSYTPTSPVEDYDNRILRFLRSLLLKARGVIEENIEITWRRW